MRIGIEKLTGVYGAARVREQSAVSNRTAQAGGIPQFDKMTLTSDSGETSEKIFIGRLSQAVGREVLSPQDKSGRIEHLREAVASGGYIPDSAEIAKRILLLGGSMA